ncbi:hypothetical protein A6E00_19960 [Vibrio diabolicus]|nr:hypothetical protein A6E00_19960 [Vibrio diabolicus]
MVVVTASWSSRLHINNVTMFILMFMFMLVLAFMMMVMLMMVIISMTMPMFRVSHHFCTKHT